MFIYELPYLLPYADKYSSSPYTKISKNKSGDRRARCGNHVARIIFML